MIEFLKAHPWLIFFFTILGAVGSWIFSLPNWSHAITTQAVGGLIGSVVSVVLAGTGSSILKSLRPTSNGK